MSAELIPTELQGNPYSYSFRILDRSEGTKITNHTLSEASGVAETTETSLDTLGFPIVDRS